MANERRARIAARTEEIIDLAKQGFDVDQIVSITGYSKWIVSQAYRFRPLEEDE